jgi:chromosome segregation ATPase
MDSNGDRVRTAVLAAKLDALAASLAELREEIRRGLEEMRQSAQMQRSELREEIASLRRDVEVLKSWRDRAVAVAVLLGPVVTAAMVYLIVYR